MLALAALLASPACRRGASREELISLRARMPPVTDARLSWSFTAKQTAPHDIGLEFSWPIEDKEVAELVERASGSVGTATAVPAAFDFSWHILEGTKELARGSGQEGVRGIVESSSSGLGGGDVKRRSLVFGTFPAQAGVTYTVRVVPKSAFGPLLRVAPAVLIEQKPTT